MSALVDGRVVDLEAAAAGRCRWCGGELVLFEVTSKSKTPPRVLQHLKRDGDTLGVQRYCDDGAHVAEAVPVPRSRPAKLVPDVWCQGCLAWVPVDKLEEHHERCPGWKAHGGRR